MTFRVGLITHLRLCVQECTLFDERMPLEQSNLLLKSGSILKLLEEMGVFFDAQCTGALQF